MGGRGIPARAPDHITDAEYKTTDKLSFAVSPIGALILEPHPRQAGH